MRTLILLLAAACAYAQVNRTTATAVQAGDLYTIADAGANDTYTGCPVIPVTAYATKALFVFKPNTVNTGAASLNVCSLGAKSLKTVAGADPADGDLAAGKYYLLVYDGTNLQILGGSGSAPTSTSLDVILNPGSDGCVTPTVNGSALEMVFSKTCLEALAFTWTGLHAFPPSTTQSITAVGNTVLANARNISVSPTSNLTLTSTPTIANGSDGQLMNVCNVNTSNTLTLQDEANLTGSNIRAGGSNVTIAVRQCRAMVYSTALGDWSVIPAGGLSSLSGQSFTWAEDTQYWRACLVTAGGTATTADFSLALTPNDAGPTNIGSLAELANTQCALGMWYHATDPKYVYRGFIVPAGFTSLDLYIHTGSNSNGAGSGDAGWRAGYRTFGALGNPHTSTTGFTNTNSATGTYSNVSAEQTFVTITNAVTVAQCPVGSYCQVRIERMAGSTYAGDLWLFGVKPVFNITRTL